MINERNLKNKSSRNAYNSAVVLFVAFLAISLSGCTAQVEVKGPSPTPSVYPTETNPALAEAEREIRDTFDSFSPEKLSDLTIRRLAETNQTLPPPLAQGIITRCDPLRIPDFTGSNDRELFVSYMCKTTENPEKTEWSMDFTRDSSPLNTGVRSEACSPNSMEMITTKTLKANELPNRLEISSDQEVSVLVTVFEIEQPVEDKKP